MICLYLTSVLFFLTSNNLHGYAQDQAPIVGGSLRLTHPQPSVPSIGPQ
jgi:hypothetical protein